MLSHIMTGIEKKCLPKFDFSAFVHQDVFCIYIFCITFEVDS
jgi:hypothetical protein